jgi:hypothetical protein
MYQGTDNITTLDALRATATSTIRAGAEIFTLINVFSVAPDHQQKLAQVGERLAELGYQRLHVRTTALGACSE